MIGRLPKTLNVNGTEYGIRSDYRDCLRIFQAMNDPDLNHVEKLEVMYRILYTEPESIPVEDIEAAIRQAVWFLDCGKEPKEEHVIKKATLYDWEHDEQIIFAAVNHVAGKEVRAEEYIHFWTFISYFHEIGEGLFSTVVHIREKKQKGELDKTEKEFYRNHKDLIDLPKRYSQEEQEEIDRINKILNG